MKYTKQQWKDIQLEKFITMSWDELYSLMIRAYEKTKLDIEFTNPYTNYTITNCKLVLNNKEQHIITFKQYMSFRAYVNEDVKVMSNTELENEMNNLV